MRNVGVIELCEIYDLGEGAPWVSTLHLASVFANENPKGTTNTLSPVSTAVEAAPLWIRPCWIIQAETFFVFFYFFGMGQGEEWVAGPWITVCWF